MYVVDRRRCARTGVGLEKKIFTSCRMYMWRMRKRENFTRNFPEHYWHILHVYHRRLQVLRTNWRARRNNFASRASKLERLRNFSSKRCPCTRVCAIADVNAHKQTHTRTCILCRIYVCVHSHARTEAKSHTHTHTRTHTNTHTHTHTHTRSISTKS
jgi:hypothetical protein